MDTKNTHPNLPGPVMQAQPPQPTQQMPTSPPPIYTTGTNPPNQPTSPVQKNRYQQPTSSLPNAPPANSLYVQPMSSITYLPNANGQPMQVAPNGQPLYPMQQQQQQQPMYPPQQYQQQQPPLQMHQPVPQSADMIYAMEKQRKDERNAKIKRDFQNACADSCSFGAKLCACCTACLCGMICASAY